MNKRLVLAAFTAATVLLTGCGQNAGEGGNRAGTMANDLQTRALTLQTDPDLQSRVRTLPGFENASVMTTGNSAVVMFDDGMTGLERNRRTMPNSAGRIATYGGGDPSHTIDVGRSAEQSREAHGRSAVQSTERATVLSTADKGRAVGVIRATNPGIRDIYFLTR